MSASDLLSDLIALQETLNVLSTEDFRTEVAKMPETDRNEFRTALLKLYDTLKAAAWKSDNFAVRRKAAPEEDEDAWEEVYNSTDERNGEPRLYRNTAANPGTFYQTYGNGGGEGGHGGYWVPEGGGDLWSVAGDEFTYHPTWTLLVRPQHSLKGQVAGVRVIARRNVK